MDQKRHLPSLLQIPNSSISRNSKNGQKERSKNSSKEGEARYREKQD